MNHLSWSRRHLFLAIPASLIVMILLLSISVHFGTLDRLGALLVSRNQQIIMDSSFQWHNMHKLQAAFSPPSEVSPTNMADALNKLIAFGFYPKNVLDIGANEGKWSQVIQAQFFNKSTHFYLIEGSPRHMATLQASNFPFIISVVGPRSGPVVFYESNGDDASTGSSMFREKTRHFDSPKVEHRYMHTLDSIMKGLPPMDFIKIDVQGAELGILQGATATLRHAEVLLIECSILQYNEDAPLAIEVLSYARSQGFELFDVADFLMAGQFGSLVQIDFVLVRKNSALFNAAGAGLIKSFSGAS